MPDARLPWGGDLSLTPAGDLASVDGDELTEQQIVRRLLTSLRGVVFHQEYGAGLPQRIGRVARERQISAVVRSQVALEASVAPLPVPVITVTEIIDNPGMFVIDIRYISAITGVATAISFETPGAR